MSTHRYPLAKLAPDYLRGAAGLAISGGLWSLVPQADYYVIGFGGLTALFLLFTIRTALRHQERVDLADESISLTGIRRRRIDRDEVDSVGLRYYSTRRSRGSGWMTLQLRAGRRRIALDSTLEGFDTVARWAAQVANRNGVRLKPWTAANFAALGIPTDSSGAGDTGMPMAASQAEGRP